MSGLAVFLQLLWSVLYTYLEGNFSFVAVDDPVATNWTIFCFNFGADFHQSSILADTPVVDAVHQ